MNKTISGDLFLQVVYDLLDRCNNWAVDQQIKRGILVLQLKGRGRQAAQLEFRVPTALGFPTELGIGRSGASCVLTTDRAALRQEGGEAFTVREGKNAYGRNGYIANVALLCEVCGWPLEHLEKLRRAAAAAEPPHLCADTLRQRFASALALHDIELALNKEVERERDASPVRRPAPEVAAAEPAPLEAPASPEPAAEPLPAAPPTPEPEPFDAMEVEPSSALEELPSEDASLWSSESVPPPALEPAEPVDEAPSDAPLEAADAMDMEEAAAAPLEPAEPMDEAPAAPAAPAASPPMRKTKPKRKAKPKGEAGKARKARKYWPLLPRADGKSCPGFEIPGSPLKHTSEDGSLSNVWRYSNVLAGRPALCNACGARELRWQRAQARAN